MDTTKETDNQRFTIKVKVMEDSIDDHHGGIMMDADSLKKKRGLRGCLDVFRSVTFLFVLLIVAATVTCGVSVWFVYANASDGPISNMSESIRNQTMGSVAAYAENFFADREAAVSQMASNIAQGGCPYILADGQEFDVDRANSMVWSVILSAPDVWIFNAMTDIDVCIGYSKQATNTSYSWFGRAGNTTNGHYQLRKFAPLVDQVTGHVDYSLNPSWQSPLPLGTLWPSVFSKVYPSSCGNNCSDLIIPNPYYYPTSGAAPSVDNYYPEYGIEYTHIRPFLVRDTGKGGLASCTFNSQRLLEWTLTLDLLGGIVYLTDYQGYLTASSSHILPVYGPNGANPPLPQTNGTVLPYGQYNYTNFPDHVVQHTGSALAALYGGYGKIPKLVSTVIVDVEGIKYSVSTQSFVTYGLEVRVVLAIPESAFVGFTAKARRNAEISVAAVIIGFCIAGALAVYFLVTRHITRTSEQMYNSVSNEGKDSILHQDHLDWESGSDSGSDSLLGPRSTDSGDDYRGGNDGDTKNDIESASPSTEYSAKKSLKNNNDSSSRRGSVVAGEGDRGPALSLLRICRCGW